ncbi:DUF397 domain-containing protein [Streptomyces sp. NPDC006992]|uniref:DUF397 domain-containing protein n=1 Tax=unclassified Streptomyces TaxID=2593676 RepID=UPI0033F8C481
MNRKTVVHPFRTSSYSGGGSANECVEVASTVTGGRAVRDSKDPARGTAYFGAEAWQAFITALGSGPEAG